MRYEYVLILCVGGIMQTRKRFEKSKVIISGDVTTMLKKAKSVLSHRQYRELCHAVNNAADYNEKKGLIKACIQAKNKV